MDSNTTLPPKVSYSLYCDTQNVTYWGDKVTVPEAFTWCLVPDSGVDVILFAGVAVVIAALWQGRSSTLLTLLSGLFLRVILGQIDVIDHLSNGMTYWLGIQPYDLFFYIFIPPLALDAGLRIDMFLLRKVICPVLWLAFGVVICGTVMLIPIMLYAFNLRAYGWQWQHVALLGSMLASTDAVAIISIMKECGGPRHLRVLLEGESLMNDASAITLFTIFMDIVMAAESGDGAVSVGGVIGQVASQTLILAGGGVLIGLGFGVVMHLIMPWLGRVGAPRDAQTALTFAAGYLSFYVANRPCQVSGVISVTIFALYGAATSRWGASVKLDEGGAFEAFWDTMAFVANGIVFFFSGLAVANFFIWASHMIAESDKNLEMVFMLAMIIPVWIAITIMRLLWTYVARPLYWITGTDITARESVFVTASGLRGSVSLILAQAVVVEIAAESREEVVKYEVVLFASGFVLITLLFQAPFLGALLKSLGLAATSAERLAMRHRAVKYLRSSTIKAINELKTDEDEKLKGVDWSMVEGCIYPSSEYADFLGPAKDTQQQQQQKQRAWWDVFHRRSTAGSEQQAGTAPKDAGMMAKVVEGRTKSEVHTAVQVTKKRLFSGKEMRSVEDEEGMQKLMEWKKDTWASGDEDVVEQGSKGAYGRVRGDVEDDDDGGDGDGDEQEGVPFALGTPSQEYFVSEVYVDSGESETQRARADEEGGSGVNPSQLADLRVRLATSLKRYYNSKRLEGLLSTKSQQILDNACDLQLDAPTKAIAMWDTIERDVGGNVFVRIMSRSVVALRGAHLRMRSWRWSWIRVPLQSILKVVSRVLMKQLVRNMTVACEVAIEYQMALQHSPLSYWLLDSDSSQHIKREMEEEAQKAEKYIVIREIEAPDQFHAIQTYRATLAVLQRQSACCEHMYSIGMVDEGEKGILLQPVQKMERHVMSKGPVSKMMTLKRMLKSLPFLRNMPPEVIDMLLQHGKLREFPAGEQICNFADGPGCMYLVISGAVAIAHSIDWRDGIHKEYFLASGDVFNLYNAVSGELVPGLHKAVAKGGSVAKGPLLYICDKEAFNKIQQLAMDGDGVYTQLLHDLYRIVALYCVGRLQVPIMADLAALLYNMALAAKAGSGVKYGTTAAAEAAARQRLTALFDLPQDETPDSTSRAEQVASMGPPSLGEELEGRHRPGSVPSSATSEPTVDQQIMRACRTQARELYYNLKPLLTTSQLKTLLPSQQYLQCTTLVVVKGALCTTDKLLAPVTCPGVHRNADGSLQFDSPFVLPWIWDSAPPEASPPLGIKFTAHPVHGATVLYCIATHPEQTEDTLESNTFSLGQDLRGQDLRTLLRSFTAPRLVPEAAEEQQGRSSMESGGGEGEGRALNVIRGLKINTAEVADNQS